jgi:hypothetical protein
VRSFLCAISDGMTSQLLAEPVFVQQKCERSLLDSVSPDRDSGQILWETDIAFGFHGAEMHDIYARMDDVGTEGVPDKSGRVQSGDVVQRHERAEPGAEGLLQPGERGVVCSRFPVP